MIADFLMRKTLFWRRVFYGLLLERVKGIEPSYSAWKAAALPLSYTRADVPLARPALRLQPAGRSIGPLFHCSRAAFNPARRRPILGVLQPTKGGDPVSYPKRCHLAEVAR